MTTITTHTKLHKLLVGTIAAAAAVVPLALTTAPAHAATSGGCTVTPSKPFFDGFNTSGVKQVRYRVTIKCDANRTVTVLQRRYEDDRAPDADDYLGATVFVRNFGGSGTKTASTLVSLRNTEGGNEEVYQRVRFQVTSNGVTSPWTSWQTPPSSPSPTEDSSERIGNTP